MMPNVPQMPNIVQMLGQFKANFPRLILQRKMNLPQNVLSDPDAILNHLVQTGQVQQAQVNGAYQVAQQLGLHR